ncbi:uncharacterized protein [Canis lupus baileyi]|uniref:uncharacterized protein isoform X3 n=1 Tax=Canis lupus baileyi TaxID=143281 RepID=UPI003B96F073
MEKARGMLTTNPSPPKVLLEEGGPCTIRCAHIEARKPRGASHSISQPAGAEGPALRRRVSSDEFQRVSNSSFPCLQNEEIVVRRPRGEPVAGDSSHRDIGAEAKQRERGRGNPASTASAFTGSASGLRHPAPRTEGTVSAGFRLHLTQVASDSGDVSLYPPGERRLRCFQSLAVMDKASTNAQSF